MERKWGPGVVGGSALYELENQGVCRVPVVADLEHEANSCAVADCAEVLVPHTAWTFGRRQTGCVKGCWGFCVRLNKCIDSS